MPPPTSEERTRSREKAKVGFSASPMHLKMLHNLPINFHSRSRRRERRGLQPWLRVSDLLPLAQDLDILAPAFSVMISSFFLLRSATATTSFLNFGCSFPSPSPAKHSFVRVSPSRQVGRSTASARGKEVNASFVYSAPTSAPHSAAYVMISLFFFREMNWAHLFRFRLFHLGILSNPARSLRTRRS